MTEYARLVVAVDSTQVRRSTDDLRRMTAESRSAGGAVGSLTPIVTRLAGAFAGLKVGQFISETVLLSSRYGELGVVMEVVGRNAGYSRIQLDELEAGLKRTGISALESRNNIARMISANIDLAKATDLARLAQDAAVIGGLNSSDAFQRLITGIQTGQVETLRTIGLNVNFQRSYEQLAQQLGKTANDLTEYEKTQARTNSVMEAAPNIAGAYEASMENAGKALRSASRHLEDFRIGLGESLQTEFAEGVELYSNSLKFLGENVDTVATLLKVGLYAAAGRAAGGVINLTRTTIANTVASSAQAAQELRLANAHVATTAQALAHATANTNLTGATGRLTAATAAHEAALRRQAAAQAAAAGIGRTLLGIMGGPVGLAVTAGAVALSFVDWSHSAEDAARQSIALREQTNLLTRAVKELDAAQAQQVLQKMEEPYKAAQDEARKYAAQIEYLTMQLDRHPGSAKVDEWNRSLVDARGNLSTVNQSIAEQEEKMRQLNARIEENTKVREENNTVLTETDKAGSAWLASLQQRSDFAGKMTETQKVLISIEKGYAGTLSETDRQAALTYAGIIDRANAAARATSGAGKATDEIGDKYRSLAESLQRQAALYGETGEVARIRYELEHGSLTALDPVRAKHLESLAAELDMQRQIQEAERAGNQYRQAMGEIAMGSLGNSELDRLTEAYFRRKEIIDEALATEFLTQQEHDAAMVLLDQETASARQRVLHEYQQAQEQAALQTMSSIVTITQSQIQQMQGLVEQGGAIGKAFFVMTQTLAAANSIIQGFQSAMAIRVAYAQMAAMSGPAAPGVLAAGEVHANVAQAMGFATAGMIAAQTIQSFDGGGYTGNGPRSGGLDGKGGFMAMVHPRETIIDHTKQKGGGGKPEISFTAQVVVESQAGMSPEESRAQGEMAAGAMRATFMSMIEKESRPGGLLWSMYGGGR